MPCKMIAPIVEELSEEYDGRLSFAKLDVDSNPTTAMTYGVRSIPTLLVFKGGQPVDQIVGAVPREPCKRRSTRHLANLYRRRPRPQRGSGWGPVALADFKSVVPR